MSLVFSLDNLLHRASVWEVRDVFKVLAGEVCIYNYLEFPCMKALSVEPYFFTILSMFIPGCLCIVGSQG